MPYEKYILQWTELFKDIDMVHNAIVLPHINCIKHYVDVLLKDQEHIRTWKNDRGFGSVLHFWEIKNTFFAHWTDGRKCCENEAEAGQCL